MAFKFFFIDSVYTFATFCLFLCNHTHTWLVPHLPVFVSLLLVLKMICVSV